MDKEKCTEDWLYQLGQILFYIGLVLELLIVIADKSAYINPCEGQLFRITFLLFLGKSALPVIHSGNGCGCCFFL